MIDRELQSRQQARVFGKIVGLLANIFAQLADRITLCVLYMDAVPGRPGITTRPAVTVGDDHAPASISFVFLGRLRPQLPASCTLNSAVHNPACSRSALRSEERRVGKECRSR